MDRPLTKDERLKKQREILEQAERFELPSQVGPGMDCDEIEIYAGLVDRGYLEGHVTRDSHAPYNGRAINVAGMRLTPFGEDYLNEIRQAEAAPAPAKSETTEFDRTVTKLKNHKLIVFVLLVVAVVGGLAAFTESISKIRDFVRSLF
jgi:hypothetical protein